MTKSGMHEKNDDSELMTPISTWTALWKSFLTVSVVMPWGMIACWGVFMSGMGMGGAPDNYLLHIISPLLPALLLWFAYSLGVSICTNRRESGIVIGLFLGWLLLTVWGAEVMPKMIRTLSSPKENMELLKAILVSYIMGAGWLVAFGILLHGFVARNANTSPPKAGAE